MDREKNSGGLNRTREDVGLSKRQQFVDGPPPRPVDTHALRALHRGELSPEEEAEIEDLIIYFREWHDADKHVLLDIARENQAKKIKTVTSQNEPPE